MPEQEHCSLPFEKGAQVPLYHSIISNFMIYQNRLQTNLLQLFAHSQNSEWFSMISDSFELNIVAEHGNMKRMTIMGALSSVATGGFSGLRTPKQSSKHPKLKHKTL